MIELDYSGARPDPAELVAEGVAGVRVYVGGSRPTRDYLQSCINAGLTIRWIFETDQTRSYAGYPAGRIDGAWSDARIDEVLPAPLTVVLADTPNISGHEAQVSAYAQGFAEASKYVDEGYGGLGALQAGRAGAPNLRWWGVETWIPGSVSTETEGHTEKNLALWREAGADVVQIFGGSPIPDTDLNEVLTASSQPLPMEDAMYLLRCKETDQVAVVSEFRVAAYPTPEFTTGGGLAIFDCTKAELDAEIQARKDLVEKLGKVEGAQAAPADFSGVQAGLEQASAGLAAATDALAQVG